LPTGAVSCRTELTSLTSPLRGPRAPFACPFEFACPATPSNDPVGARAGHVGDHPGRLSGHRSVGIPPCVRLFPENDAGRAERLATMLRVRSCVLPSVPTVVRRRAVHSVNGHVRLLPAQPRAEGGSFSHQYDRRLAPDARSGGRDPPRCQHGHPVLYSGGRTEDQGGTP